MSGLSPSSASVPHEVKSETRPAVTSGSSAVLFVQVSVVGPALTRATSASPLACDTSTTGIVIPPPATVGLSGIGLLFISTTATAPFAWAFAAFTEKKHVPRRISAIRPETDAGMSAGSQPKLFVFTSSALPDVGVTGESERMYGNSFPSGETAKAGPVIFVLSNDAA